MQLRRGSIADKINLKINLQLMTDADADNWPGVPNRKLEATNSNLADAQVELSNWGQRTLLGHYSGNLVSRKVSRRGAPEECRLTVVGQDFE